MGARKRIKADVMKEARKKIAFAKLNNCPTSPRKMRLIADLIRGMDAEKANIRADKVSHGSVMSAAANRATPAR